MANPLFLSVEDVIEIHADQIQRYGGSLGIRDVELLHSALGMPEAGFGDQYLHAACLRWPLPSSITSFKIIPLSMVTSERGQWQRSYS